MNRDKKGFSVTTGTPFNKFLIILGYRYLIERDGTALHAEQSELKSSACKTPMFHVPAHSEELG